MGRRNPLGRLHGTLGCWMGRRIFYVTFAKPSEAGWAEGILWNTLMDVFKEWEDTFQKSIL
ncbi:Hypothetical protein FKW44_005748 [Caligus rogercresseyi]|uniref:Uncharacterized protein n=1 Tax=Caligus rogercresseyi TaxID=217165 RepID=A0A7T8KCE3_CALRO|nr:Hypothetical protein FKW44_005748 [Caligus rogercresseyi]